MKTISYIESELDKLGFVHETLPKIQLSSDSGKTKLLNITPEQLEQIKKILLVQELKK